MSMACGAAMQRWVFREYLHVSEGPLPELVKLNAWHLQSQFNFLFQFQFSWRRVYLALKIDITYSYDDSNIF